MTNDLIREHARNLHPHMYQIMQISFVHSKHLCELVLQNSILVHVMINMKRDPDYIFEKT